MDASGILYTAPPANAMRALSTEMQMQQQQQTSFSPLVSTNITMANEQPTTPRSTSHTPREIPTMYILDQMYDDYMDQYNGNNITTPTEVPETNASSELAPCPICARTFNPVTLRKHVGICEKMAMKKRNKFDSSRQRREGTELATYCLPKNFGLPEKTTSTSSITQGRNDRGQSPKPNVQQISSPILTRKKPSEDLIRSTARTSMRKVAASSGNSNNNLVAASSTPSPNFNRDRMRSSERSLTRRGIQPPPAEQCPHCERCFGIKAYDRHVEWCKEKALLASIKHGSSKNEGNVAKARLEARTKYRAPCLKTKRSINREKYSGLAGEEQDTEDLSKCSKTSLNKTQENNLMSMSMTSSMCSERNIRNSTTGNINEPVATKENKNKLSKLKAARDPEKAAQKNSQRSAPKSKTADVETYLSVTANNLVQKKSGNDFSLKSTLRGKCWQQTHKTSENVNDNLDDRQYDDNDSDFDEMKFEAKQMSKDNLDYTNDFKNVGSPKRPQENPNETIILRENYDAKEMANFEENFSNFQYEENEENKFQNLNNKTNLVMKSAGRLKNEEKQREMSRGPSPVFCYSKENDDIEKFAYHYQNQLFEQNVDSQDFDEMSDKPKNSRKQHSKNGETSRSLRIQNSYDKITKENCNLRNNEESSATSKCTEENSKSNEFLSEVEIFKDCLTDSDELRRRLNPSKVNLSTPEISDRTNELKPQKLKPSKAFKKSSSKSETFIRDLNQKLHKLQQLPEYYEETTLDKNSKSSEDLDISYATLPQVSPFSVSVTTPDTIRLGPLKISPSKRKKLLRKTASCTNTSSFPMKAFMLPLSMDNLEICGVSSASQINSDNKRKCNKQQEMECSESHAIEANDEKKKKTSTSVMSKKIKVIKEPSQLKRNRSFTVIGLPDNYDPFLSAKRQLEELCSPSADSVDLQNTPLTPKLPSMPDTPNSNSKMSTSLILSSSTAPTNTTPSLMTTSQMPQQTQKTPILARSSSFRRTSSLRGPRRSPMLSSRPPLFAQKHRPTIQRGLSDEGPISTNFLKPEEYDEMPVRAVCVNDFALNKSPRVIRRDTSASNRKQPLKLNINAANNSNTNSNTNSPHVVEAEVSNSNTASKYVSKTDSLAVFLKFEHDLENVKNNTASTGETLKNEAAVLSSPSADLDGPLSTKELKDKSNNLSKQNSNKNIKADILASGGSVDNENIAKPFKLNDMEGSKYGPIRLAPLNTKTSTPFTTKPSTPQLTQQPTSTFQLTALNTKNSTNQNALKTNKPVALQSLFGSESKSSKQTSLLYTESQNANGSDYIDPKLINKCDNLPIHLNLKRTDFKYADSDASETRLEQFSSSSSESSAKVKKSTSQQQQQQHNKLLPLVKQQQPQYEHHEPLNLTATPSAHLLSHSASNSQRNSAEGRNLLKRRMRVGRNQFLYDASPEGDSCSADDEGANRSSMEGDVSQRQLNPSTSRERERAYERLSSNQANSIDAPFIPPLPAFDDFDFEEFLSSFENDEEQFPLFKDCREFLLNRTSKKQRSMLMPNSNITHTQTNTLNSSKQPCKKSPSPQTFPPLTSQTLANNGQQHQQQHPQHFQFPSLNQPTKNLFNSFSFNTRNKYDDLATTQATDAFCFNPEKEEYRDLDSQSLNQKREIFISIETEQNDLDKSSLSPNSIRHMVGNPQTVVEVEVDAAHDNKFSKISDDDDAADGLQDPNIRNRNFGEHLPNVQMNNAKNLMQKMQENFRQLGEDMSTQLRLTKESKTAPVDVNMNTSTSLNATTRNVLKVNHRTTGCPSGDAYGDSDELSSLDGYPLSSPSSRLGVSSKTSADSAYGSLSRQRSSELSTQRSSSRSRNMATNTATTLINRPLTEETSLTRLRQLSASSSSSSEHTLPPITSSSNNAYHKQQHQNQHHQQLQHSFSNSSNSNNNNMNHKLTDVATYECNNNNNNIIYDNSPSLVNLTGATNSQSNLESLQHYTSNSTMSTSMKMSKFCHECGSKFILEQAKFCMDCGVKRVVL